MKKLLTIDAKANEEKICIEFDKIAKQLLNETIIKTPKDSYLIREIEFYYFSENHTDYYCHKNDRQLTNSSLYFHRFKNPEKYYNQKQKGIDITFGNNSDIYGGILLRSVQSFNTREIISGICKIANRIINEIGGNQELNSEFAPSGKIYNTETNNDLGTFSTDISISSDYVEIIANGYYFNEITGELAGPITLRNLSELSESASININILTTLAKDRIKYLILNEGDSFTDAKNKAEKELLRIFNIPEEYLDDNLYFENMDISKTGDANAILLAVSTILQQDNTPAELSELISKITSDIEPDGVLNSTSLLEELRINGMNVNAESVINNLSNRYRSLNIDIVIPEFKNFIDNDGDGVLNMFDFELIFPKGEIALTKPLFTWTTPEKTLNEQPNRYRIQISEDAGFETIVEENSDITTNSYTAINILDNDKTYNWRVASFDDNNVASDWTKASEFNVELPRVTLISPENNTNIVNNQPTFSWAPVEDENAEYILQILFRGNYEQLIYEATNIKESEITIDFPLKSNVYIWRVAYADENGVRSEWTSSTISIDDIIWVEPSGEISETKPIIKWESQHENVSYDLFIYDMYHNKIFQTEVDTTEYKLGFDLERNTQYNWEVIVDLEDYSASTGSAFYIK